MSLFEPWHDTKFDLIIDDISGISSEVALMSEWFDGVPCESGIDGTDLIVQVLSAAKNHLNVGGAIYFPVLSLSNRTRIFQEAKEHFNEIDLIESVQWPLPASLALISIVWKNESRVYRTRKEVWHVSLLH